MSRTFKLSALVAVSAAVALVLAGCTTSDPESPDDAGGDTRDRVSLNVGYIDTSINGVGIIAVANDQDLWDKAGIDVNLTPFTNGPTQIQAMAAGSIDVGYIGGGAVWMPATGQATIIVPNEATLGDVLIASPASGAKSVDDLKGLTVGVPEGGSGEMILALALDKAGFTEDDITRVPLDPPSVVSAFVAGSIDVAAIFSPLSDQIFEAVPDAVAIADNKTFPETEFMGAWVASNQAVADKPDAVSRFLEVWAQANDFRMNSTAETVALSSAESGAPEDQLQGQADKLVWWSSEQILEDNESGRTYQRFASFIDLFVKLGRMDKATDPKDFVNTELFAQAMEHLNR